MSNQSNISIELAEKRKEFTDLLYIETKDNYLNNKFYDWILSEFQNIQKTKVLDKRIIRYFLNEIEECYYLLKDYRNGEYNKIDKDGIMKILILSLYIVKPEHLCAKYQEMYSVEMQYNIIYTLLTGKKTSKGIDFSLEDYREYCFLNSTFPRHRMSVNKSDSNSKTEEDIQKPYATDNVVSMKTETTNFKAEEESSNVGSVSDWGMDLSGSLLDNESKKKLDSLSNF